MDQFLAKAEYNQRFHDSNETQFPGEFHDWKTTALFYVALHYVKALAAKGSIDIGESHESILRNLKPDNPEATMRFTKTAFNNYRDLFKDSCKARYDGITGRAGYDKLKQEDHSRCLKRLHDLKLYLQGRGLPMNASTAHSFKETISGQS